LGSNSKCSFLVAFFTTQVTLGGRLYTTQAKNVTDANKAFEAEQKMKQAVKSSLSAPEVLSISARGSHENEQAQGFSQGSTSILGKLCLVPDQC
jgi:hypothetical protein